MKYTLSTTLAVPYADAVTATREALARQGFGVLTEIDLKATLKAKIDVDIAPQIILGACRPQLAHQALMKDPAIAAVLPCNVVVRALDAHTTVVEAFDPDAMMGLAGEAMKDVATDARTRLSAALTDLTKHQGA
jgi:uncharacterized protein (DUF302 family)